MIPKKGKRVTYLIGAGASANALPTVVDMPKAFNSQRIWLEHVVGQVDRNPALAQYLGRMGYLARKATLFGSIDTYARSLHLGRKRQELIDLKRHLSLFFLLEQAYDHKTYTNTYVKTPPYSREVRIETRYLNWLALLLDENSVMTERVNLLSWNYDLQVEHAVGMFLGLSEMQQIYDRRDMSFFPKLVGPVRQKTVPFLVHLNGIAGQRGVKHEERWIYDGIDGGNTREHIRRLFNEYERMSRGEPCMIGLGAALTFAWEKTPMSMRAIEYALDSLDRSDVLVIIGYSFPSFNRFVDEGLIGAFCKADKAQRRKRIVIQSPSLSEASFWNMFGTVSRVRTQVETNTGQFLIPTELFH